MTGAQRLVDVDAAKQTHTELGEVTLDLHRIEQRLTALRWQLAFAITMYDSSAVIELPDEGEEPRD
jgi:hypothetical protein